MLKRIPAKYRNRIIASISIDTPLSIAAPLIPDESYWERRSKKYFRLANVKDFGNSWKRLYFELHTRDLLEKFQPESDSTMAKKLEDLIPQIQTAAPFVKVLHLREFRPVEPRPPLNFYAATDKLANKSELTALMKDIAPDHLDLTLVLPQLSNLTDFSVYYG